MKTIKVSLFALTLITYFISPSTSFAHSILFDYFYQKKHEKPLSFALKQSIKAKQFQQLIDYDDPLSGTFNQRYYIDESYSTSNDSPVFFHICGEASCEKRALDGAIRTYAQKHHAKLIALEHRYYGESLPHPSYSTKNLRHLSTKLALADLAYFQQQISKNQNWTGKWVAFGGSYAGSLSAYYRLKYPHLVVGALASSAPVMAKENFFEYDAQMTKAVGEQCAGKIRQAVTEIEEALSDPVKKEQIKKLFIANEINNDIDFIYMVADIGAFAVQYGMKNDFCSALIESTSPLQGYANYACYLFDHYKMSPASLTFESAISENPKDYKPGSGSRQWLYQSCSEYGYWQNANPDKNQSTRSALINPAYHKKVCQRLFGLEKASDADAINQQYYFPLMNGSASHIYFTNGTDDPWSTLSLSKTNGNANNENFTYTSILNAAHCEDLHTPLETDSKALKTARNQMESLLNLWLKD